MESGIILGAAGDIGSAVTRRFVSTDRLLLIDQDADRLTELCDSLQESKQRNTVVRALDISHAPALKSAIDQFASTCPPDYLVNCAGLSYDGTSDIKQEHCDLMIDVNLRAAIYAACAVIPHMKKPNRGHIITLASQSGLRARPFLGGYAASKFGIVGFNEALYKELANTNIRCTAVCAGMVATRMTAGDHHICPPNLMIQVDQIVECIDYLRSLSDSCSIDRLVIECKAQINYKG